MITRFFRWLTEPPAEAIARSWIRAHRPDIAEMKLHHRVAELVAHRADRPPLDEMLDDQWIERAVAEEMGRL